ncbi:MAG TPA: FGGY-family carbohydrate kinase [Thermomicrobiales bacterium]
MALLGIDVGTTACKAAAFAEDGTLLATASKEYVLRTPAPNHLELDPDDVWAAVAGCIRRVNEQLTGESVVALAVSAQGEAVTPVGRDGAALAPSPVTFDNRAIEQAQRLEAAIGREKLARITGQPPHPMFTIAKLMWWRDHDPDLVQRTWKFLCYGDLVSFRLGAEPAIDYSMAARTMAFDIRAHCWAEPVLAAAGIEAEKLATPVPAGTVIGRVRADVASDLGFSDPPLIVAGGHDQPCGVFGAGASAVGEAMLAIGTTICLAPVLSAPRDELLDHDYPCYPHVVPDQYVTLAGNFTGGSLLRWYRDVLGEAERQAAAETGSDVYELIVGQAVPEPSGLLVLPHFAGSGSPHNDPLSRGAIVGLTFATSRGHLIKALLEGVMLEMAVNRACLAAAGVSVESAVAVGGGARSDRWLQIAADVMGIPIRRAAQREAACWGAARLAGVGAGLLDPAAPTSGASERRFAPNPDHSRYYQERLSAYRSLYSALRPMSSAI